MAWSEWIAVARTPSLFRWATWLAVRTKRVMESSKIRITVEWYSYLSPFMSVNLPPWDETILKTQEIIVIKLYVDLLFSDEIYLFVYWVFILFVGLFYDFGSSCFLLKCWTSRYDIYELDVRYGIGELSKNVKRIHPIIMHLSSKTTTKCTTSISSNFYLPWHAGLLQEHKCPISCNLKNCS